MARGPRTEVRRLPLSPSKLAEAWQEAAAKVEAPVSLVLAGDDDLVAQARERFAAGGTMPALWTKEPLVLLESGLGPHDIGVFLVRKPAEGALVAALRSQAQSARSPVRAVIGVYEEEVDGGRMTHPAEGCTLLAWTDTAQGWRRIAEACLEAAGERMVALGRHYPSLRRLAARRLVYRAAQKNGLVGLAFFLPGADWPVMTLNQLRMLLEIAGLYGQAPDSERAVEAAAVAALSLGFRRLGRRLAGNERVRKWAVQGATGYAATLALGMALVEYFERGAPASTSHVLRAVASLKQ